jgi:hypothetical protein
MAYLIGSIFVQVMLIIHCVKTGRNQIWIWVLALLSIPGAIAYIAVELLPDLLGNRRTKRAVRDVKGVLDPERDLRKAERVALVSGDVASRQRYAEELSKQRRHAEAADVYRTLLTGLYETDPSLMLGLARAQFESGDAAGAKATLEALIAANPDFKSAEGHLLFARAVEATGDADKALEEYRVLADYFPGGEAAVRYARLLSQQGRSDDARRVLRELVDRMSLAPPHVRKAQQAWLSEAERGA